MKTVSDTAYVLACSIVGISPDQPAEKESPYWQEFRASMVYWAIRYLKWVLDQRAKGPKYLEAIQKYRAYMDKIHPGTRPTREDHE